MISRHKVIVLMSNTPLCFLFNAYRMSLRFHPERYSYRQKRVHITLALPGGREIPSLRTGRRPRLRLDRPAATRWRFCKLWQMLSSVSRYFIVFVEARHA